MQRFLPILVLTACAGTVPGTPDGPGPDDSGDEVVPTESCRTEVTELLPETDAVVPTDTTVQAWFSDPVTADDIRLGVEGVPGVVHLDDNGLHAVFVPDAPLAPDTAFRAEAQACEHHVLQSFHTEAPLDPATLDGAMWFTALPEAQWVYPSVVDMLGTLEDGLLVEARRAGSSLELVSAIASDGADPEQSTCFEPSVLGSVQLDDHDFAAGPADVVLPMGVGLPVRDALLLGRFSADGDSLEQLELSGVIDTRDVSPELCEVTAYIGEPCVACEDGVEACLVAYLELSDAASVEAAPIDLESGIESADADCY